LHPARNAKLRLAHQDLTPLPSAIYIALRFLDASFDELLAFTAACKGDVDTIGAMAGAIWGARNGAEALPANLISRLEQANRIRDVANKLYEATMRKENRITSACS